MRPLTGALGLVALLSVLAACAPAAGGAIAQQPPPAATATVAPTPMLTPTIAPTATSAPVAPASPTPSSPAPPVLDVRPASMSIVGHLDCTRNGAYICHAEVLALASNQTGLSWRAFTNVPGGITFSPSSGALAPGKTVLLTIRVPFNACERGLFFFRGPANTHTISWAC